MTGRSGLRKYGNGLAALDRIGRVCDGVERLGSIGPERQMPDCTGA